MNPGDVERLARWGDSLQGTILEASAQLARPLRSPGLRCACALVQVVRLARVVRHGAMVARVGMAQARLAARVGHLAEVLRLGQIVYRTGKTVGLASGVCLLASGRAAREGWAAWSTTAQALPRPSPRQRLIRTVALGRAALMALGGS